jgi:hypothetical protein
MFLSDLFLTENTNTVAIIFGRFNPAHRGHRAAWETAAEYPQWYVGTNKSTVGPKDPLPYNVKVKVMQAIWPEVSSHIVAEQSWLTLASRVYDEHGSVELVCCTDEDWVTQTIMQYNGKTGSHGYYDFASIRQQATPRLSSATALRSAVVAGDREAFSDAAGIPADTVIDGKPFFDLVAEYLLPYQNAPKKATKKKEKNVSENKANLYKQIDESAWPFDYPVREEAAGVGVIANKKQARDPRYSMSLTKDVRPGEVERSLKKLSLR